MTREQIKAQVATENSLDNLTFNFVRQFDNRPLKENESNVIVKDPNNPNATLTASYDATNPEVKYHVKTPWLSHWENTKRVRVVMHEDVLTKLQTDPTYNALSFKKVEETAKASGLKLIRYVIITPANVEASW